MPASGERTPTLRLRELGLALPEPPRPLGHYQAAVQTGSLLVLSGMLPLRQGVITTGRLGDGISNEAGRAAARLAALVGYRILDTPPERAFDDLVEFAATVCDTPVAAMITAESAEGEGTTFRVSLAKTPILAAMPSKHAA